MSDHERKNVGQLLDAEPTPAVRQDVVADGTTRPPGFPNGALQPMQSVESQPAPVPARPHPVVFADPRALTFLAVGRLRQQRIPVHIFAENRFEPALYARGVTRHRMPAMHAEPETWQARLLELVARIEPRPVLIPCSSRARSLLRNSRRALLPHFEIAHLDTLRVHGYETEDFRTERTLRRTIVRGDPAFEVQVTLDADGNCTAACVLTWLAGVPPHLVVTSVEGHEVLERSLEWLRTRGVRGYARLIWAPDRFGRVDLQAAGTLPGSGWQLALDDGVDFPLMWYACLAGVHLPAQFAKHELSAQVRIAHIDAENAMLPLCPSPSPNWHEDPLARLVGWVGSLRR